MKHFSDRLVSRIGRSGIAGIGIFVFCVMFYYSGALPASREVETLRIEALQLEASSRNALRQPGAGETDPQARLTALLRDLPGEDSISEITGKMFQAARKNQMILKTGNYQVIPEKSGRLGRYQMTFQTDAPYYLIRFFVRDILQEVPALSLDDISFQRQQVSAPKAETTLKFTLLLTKT